VPKAGGSAPAQRGTSKAAQGAGANPSAGGTPATPPNAPGGGPNEPEPLPPANAPGEIRREAQRPAYSPRTLRPDFRNVLSGIVLSSAAGEPEEGVRVTVTDQSGQFLNKVALTNAFGRFAVRLADGDWTVNVTMPSGRVYPVHQVRVSNGQVTDPQGRRIPSLEITR
jgi:hypothetical protein